MVDMISFESIREGHKASHRYTITDQVYQSFLDAFEDRNPLHVDEAAAVAQGFRTRVMHGAILSGFLSHFVGMRLPGENALILSTDIRFLKPNYPNDCIAIEAVVSQKAESQRVLVLDVTFQNETQSLVTARGRVQVLVPLQSSPQQ
jgi:3-hydroxybutyryl-CoA dehydratase